MQIIMRRPAVLATVGFVCLMLMRPLTAKAVVPPDFIFNIGSQLVQFFSLLALSLSVVFGTVYRFLRLRLTALGFHRWFLVAGIVGLLATTAGATYWYRSYRQQQEYQKWLSQSRQDEASLGDTAVAQIDSDGDGLSDSDEVERYRTDPHSPDTDGDGYTDGTEVQHGYSPLKPSTSANQAPTQQEPDASNQLQFDSQTITSRPSQAFNSRLPASATANQAFIEAYYRSIATGQLNHAYTASSREVPLATFRSWYQNTTAIILDRYVPIDETRSSLELTLFEGDDYTRYGVVNELGLQDGAPTRIADSQVQLLSAGTVGETSSAPVDGYYIAHADTPLVATNAEFRRVTVGSGEGYLVLDAREDVEYENGHFPRSTHIRFADLKAGRWIELPRDRRVYVLCWSGIRGREVAEFLRTKKIVASYLEDGANGWVEYGGTWEGNIAFASRYTERRFQLVFTTAETRDHVANGAQLVDTREPAAFARSHIPGSVNIPTMYTPTINLEKTFAQIPPGSRVVTVCDGYVNCFDAKITGVELERRGHTFLGRYNKPWEY